MLGEWRVKTSLRVHKSTWRQLVHAGRGVLSVSEICLVLVLVQNNIDTSHKIQLCTAKDFCAKTNMQKSIWSASNEVLKYNSIRPDHPVQIVDNVVKFLKQKYKV